MPRLARAATALLLATAIKGSAVAADAHRACAAAGAGREQDTVLLQFKVQLGDEPGSQVTAPGNEPSQSSSPDETDQQVVDAIDGAAAAAAHHVAETADAAHEVVTITKNEVLGVIVRTVDVLFGISDRMIEGVRLGVDAVHGVLRGLTNLTAEAANEARRWADERVARDLLWFNWNWQQMQEQFGNMTEVYPWMVDQWALQRTINTYLLRNEVDRTVEELLEKGDELSETLMENRHKLIDAARYATFENVHEQMIYRDDMRSAIPQFQETVAAWQGYLRGLREAVEAGWRFPASRPPNSFRRVAESFSSDAAQSGFAREEIRLQRVLRNVQTALESLEGLVAELLSAEPPAAES